MAKAWLRFFVLVPVAVVSAAACGGSAFETTGTGGSLGVAGGANHAGATSSGGTSSGGGASSAGGSVSRGGTTSIAGSSSGGTFSAGGSEAHDIRECASNTDCVIEPATCCGCGQGPVSNFTAINASFQGEYQPPCAGVACAPCPPIAQNPNDPTLYYVPTCQAGRCTVVDLNATDITKCTTGTDCSLRAGTGCCEACSGPPVALNTSKDSELSSLVCGTEPSSCAGCIDSLPEYSTSCTAGRCTVVLSPCTAANPCGI